MACGEGDLLPYHHLPHSSRVFVLSRIFLTPGDKVQSLGQEDPLEEETATHSSILVWRIPWTEEPGGLLSMGLHRVGHD